MVWACGKNGSVPYGMKGVNGRHESWARYRPRLGSMDGVKVTLDNKGMIVVLRDNARKIGKNGEPWCICN